jgi:hypothetical protein
MLVGRPHKGGLFSADKGPRALHQLDVEVESAVEDVVAEEAVFAGLLDGAGEAADGQGILGAHVYDAFAGAHDIGTDDHAFEQRMGVTLDFVAVHVSAGIAFVGVADDVFCVRLGLGQEIPLVAGEEACAATSAEAGGLDLLDDAVGATIDEHLVEGLVAADGNVLLNVFGVDEAAVAQDDFLLAFEERNRVPRGDFRVALAVFQAGGNVIPFLDLAVDQVGGHDQGGEVFENSAGIVGLDAVQDDHGMAGHADADQRLLEAGAEAADTGEQDVETSVLDGFVQGVKDLFRAVAPATSSHAHGDARNSRQQLGQARFTHRVERTNILNSRHYFLPWVRALTSRCSVRSLTWLRMW